MKIKNIFPWKQSQTTPEQADAPARREADGTSFEPVHRLFDDFFNDFAYPTGKRFSPSLDVSETDDDYVVTAEIPGIDEKEVDVVVERGRLIISGEKRFDHETRGSNYHHAERAYGRFERVVRLPESVTGDGAKAEFKSGVLNIRIPKPDEVKNRVKSIPVTAGS